jgi:hypothetical protein
MAFAPSSPATGAAVTGLTSPTYTLTSDMAPNINGKQYAVTALGGTQTNVETHTVSKPFTITFFRPAVLRALPSANPTTGIVKNIPVNTYKFNTRKGAVPYVNQQAQLAMIQTIITVPAGTDTYEPEDIKAMISAHFGVGWAAASGIADTVLTGIV